MGIFASGVWRMVFIRRMKRFLEDVLGILEKMLMLLEFGWTWGLDTLLFVAKNGRENGTRSFIRTMVSDIRRRRSDIRRWSGDISIFRPHI